MKKVLITACGLIAAQTCYGAEDYRNAGASKDTPERRQHKPYYLPRSVTVRLPDRDQNARYAPFAQLSRQDGFGQQHTSGHERFLFDDESSNTASDAPQLRYQSDRLTSNAFDMRSLFGSDNHHGENYESDADPLSRAYSAQTFREAHEVKSNRKKSNGSDANSEEEERKERVVTIDPATQAILDASTAEDQEARTQMRLRGTTQSITKAATILGLGAIAFLKATFGSN